MNIVALLKFITSHPLNKKNKLAAIKRFVKWQLNCRINSEPVIHDFTDRSKLIIKKGMTGATQNLYCGLQEFSDMSFLLHLLRKGDQFADVGANIGSFTVLASGHVGARTYAFEPVPSTYQNLLNNIAINHISQVVEPFNMAAGSSKGVIPFTSTYDTMNHVATATDQNVINVEVTTLDNLLAGRDCPLLIKIDVEGFETEVIKGAEGLFKNPALKALIIELNGSGKRYGYNEMNIHDKLVEYNFKPYTYEPFTRSLESIDSIDTHNTIYVRDADFVLQRLKAAEKVNVLNQAV